MPLHEKTSARFRTTLKATRECFLVAQRYSWISEWSIKKDANRIAGITWNCFSRNSWSTKPEEEIHKALTKHGKSEEEFGLHIHEEHVTHTPLKGNVAAFLPLFKETTS